MSTPENETTHSSFAIVLTPEFNEDKTWNGAVEIHIEEDNQNDLDADQLEQIRSVSGLLATCLPLMEQDPEFLEYVQNFYLENFQTVIDELDELGDDKPNFTRSEDGKVITLNFSSKTYGSA
jgi:hypothetical protein